MSDSAIIIAELTVSAQDAPARAVATAPWLLDQGVIQYNDRPGPAWRSSQYVDGPAATPAAPGFHRYPDLTNRSIDITDRRLVHDPGGNYSPPTCPNSVVPLDKDAHIALSQPWLVATEAIVACTNCAAPALLGDWNGRGGIHVANLVVRFGQLATSVTRSWASSVIASAHPAA